MLSKDKDENDRIERKITRIETWITTLFQEGNQPAVALSVDAIGKYSVDAIGKYKNGHLNSVRSCVPRMPTSYTVNISNYANSDGIKWLSKAWSLEGGRTSSSLKIRSGYVPRYVQDCFTESWASEDAKRPVYFDTRAQTCLFIVRVLQELLTPMSSQKAQVTNALSREFQSETYTYNEIDLCKLLSFSKMNIDETLAKKIRHSLAEYFFDFLIEKLDLTKEMLEKTTSVYISYHLLEKIGVDFLPPLIDCYIKLSQECNYKCDNAGLLGAWLIHVRSQVIKKGQSVPKVISEEQSTLLEASGYSLDGENRSKLDFSNDSELGDNAQDAKQLESSLLHDLCGLFATYPFWLECSNLEPGTTPEKFLQLTLPSDSIRDSSPPLNDGGSGRSSSSTVEDGSDRSQERPGVNDDSEDADLTPTPTPAPETTTTTNVRAHEHGLVPNSPSGGTAPLPVNGAITVGGKQIVHALFLPGAVSAAKKRKSSEDSSGKATNPEWKPLGKRRKLKTGPKKGKRPPPISWHDQHRSSLLEAVFGFHQFGIDRKENFTVGDFVKMQKKNERDCRSITQGSVYMLAIKKLDLDPEDLKEYFSSSSSSGSGSGSSVKDIVEKRITDLELLYKSWSMNGEVVKPDDVSRSKVIIPKIERIIRQSGRGYYFDNEHVRPQFPKNRMATFRNTLGALQLLMAFFNNPDADTSAVEFPTLLDASMAKEMSESIHGLKNQDESEYIPGLYGLITYLFKATMAYLDLPSVGGTVFLVDDSNPDSDRYYINVSVMPLLKQADGELLADVFRDLTFQYKCISKNILDAYGVNYLTSSERMTSVQNALTGLEKLYRCFFKNEKSAEKCQDALAVLAIDAAQPSRVVVDENIKKLFNVVTGPAAAVLDAVLLALMPSWEAWKKAVGAQRDAEENGVLDLASPQSNAGTSTYHSRQRVKPQLSPRAQPKSNYPKPNPKPKQLKSTVRLKRRRKSPSKPSLRAQNEISRLVSRERCKSAAKFMGFRTSEASSSSSRPHAVSLLHGETFFEKYFDDELDRVLAIGDKQLENYVDTVLALCPYLLGLNKEGQVNAAVVRALSETSIDCKILLFKQLTESLSRLCADSSIAPTHSDTISQIFCEYAFKSSPPSPIVINSFRELFGNQVSYLEKLPSLQSDNVFRRIGGLGQNMVFVTMLEVRAKNSQQVSENLEGSQGFACQLEKILTIPGYFPSYVCWKKNKEQLDDFKSLKEFKALTFDRSLWRLKEYYFGCSLVYDLHVELKPTEGNKKLIAATMHVFKWVRVLLPETIMTINRLIPANETISLNDLSSLDDGSKDIQVIVKEVFNAAFTEENPNLTDSDRCSNAIKQYQAAWYWFSLLSMLLELGLSSPAVLDSIDIPVVDIQNIVVGFKNLSYLMHEKGLILESDYEINKKYMPAMAQIIAALSKRDDFRRDDFNSIGADIPTLLCLSDEEKWLEQFKLPNTQNIPNTCLCCRVFGAPHTGDGAKDRELDSDEASWLHHLLMNSLFVRDYEEWLLTTNEGVTASNSGGGSSSNGAGSSTPTTKKSQPHAVRVTAAFVKASKKRPVPELLLPKGRIQRSGAGVESPLPPQSSEKISDPTILPPRKRYKSGYRPNNTIFNNNPVVSPVSKNGSEGNTADVVELPGAIGCPIFAFESDPSINPQYDEVDGFPITSSIKR